MIIKAVTLTHLTEQDAQEFYFELHLLLDAYREKHGNTDALIHVKQHISELHQVLIDKK